MKSPSGSSVLLVSLYAAAILLYLAAGAAGADDESGPGKGRSFYMGMTPFSYDVGDEALERTYEIVNARTDLIAHHLDDGVPWREAYKGKAYHPNFMANLDYRVSQVQQHQSVYLAVTPLSTLRDGLAAYWGESPNMERPGAWKNRELDDVEVIEAYTNHCIFMIELFQPAYMAYGIEVNLLAQNDPAAFRRFKKLAKRVYGVLKRRFPNLPVFLTFSMSNRQGFEQCEDAIAHLLPYTDLLAVSTYPFMTAESIGKEGRVDMSWLADVQALDPSKPIAIAETAFIAEDLLLSYLGATIPGSERGQARFLKRILKELNKLEAAFLVWFIPIDYDSLWELMESVGCPEWMKAWRDTGLFDESLDPRRSARVWDRWFARGAD